MQAQHPITMAITLVFCTGAGTLKPPWDSVGPTPINGPPQETGIMTAAGNIEMPEPVKYVLTSFLLWYEELAKPIPPHLVVSAAPWERSWYWRAKEGPVRAVRDDEAEDPRGVFLPASQQRPWFDIQALDHRCWTIITVVLYEERKEHLHHDHYRTTWVPVGQSQWIRPIEANGSPDWCAPHAELVLPGLRPRTFDAEESKAYKYMLVP